MSVSLFGGRHRCMQSSLQVKECKNVATYIGIKEAKQHSCNNTAVMKYDYRGVSFLVQQIGQHIAVTFSYRVEDQCHEVFIGKSGDQMRADPPGASQRSGFGAHPTGNQLQVAFGFPNLTVLLKKLLTLKCSGKKTRTCPTCTLWSRFSVDLNVYYIRWLLIV